MTDPAPASAADVLAAAAGRVRVWSLAPEREGALPFIAWLAAQGVVPALGHSAADFADVGRAVAAGARLVTHAYACLTAFSGTGPAKRLGGNEGALHHRALTLETLADNAHLTPELLAWLVGTAGWRRLCTTTDAMAAAGLGDGVYRFLEQEVHVVGGRAYRPDRTHFAGSTATVPECLANLQAAAGLTAAEAVATATAVPARLLGRYPEYGAIAPGSVADAVLFDSTWQIDVVIRGGQVVVEGNHPAADVVKAVH